MASVPAANLLGMRMVLRIAPDDPRAEDVHALLERHLSSSFEATPPEHVHALDAEGRERG